MWLQHDVACHQQMSCDVLFRTFMRWLTEGLLWVAVAIDWQMPSVKEPQHWNHNHYAVGARRKEGELLHWWREEKCAIFFIVFEVQSLFITSNTLPAGRLSLPAMSPYVWDMIFISCATVVIISDEDGVSLKFTWHYETCRSDVTDCLFP